MNDTPAAGPVTYPDLAGKIAVVTGGSRGIGAATAQALARNGVAVAVVGRDHAALEAVARAIGAEGGRAIAVVADCTVEADLQALRRQVHDQFGPAGILAAFAGGYGEPVATSSETPGRWHQVLDSNLTATFLAISAFLPDLTARSGVIITMASESGRRATRASAAYAAAKGGIVALSRHLAGELAPAGVRVNCLAPSTIENEKIRTRMPAEARQRLAASFPLGRIGQPADPSAATLFLASDASSWITGITLDITGGKDAP
jgi:3-oxoacyl-[acyl-carrier protein] reductase